MRKVVNTVGELKAALAEFDDNTPNIECERNIHHVFPQGIVLKTNVFELEIKRPYPCFVNSTSGRKNAIEAIQFIG